MGFFPPLTIAAKILNLELRKEKIDWDDLLPQKFCERFSRIAADIDNYHPVVPTVILDVGTTFIICISSLTPVHTRL
jgi:hypothetical protein